MKNTDESSWASQTDWSRIHALKDLTEILVCTQQKNLEAHWRAVFWFKVTELIYAKRLPKVYLSHAQTSLLRLLSRDLGDMASLSPVRSSIVAYANNRRLPRFYIDAEVQRAA